MSSLPQPLGQLPFFMIILIISYSYSIYYSMRFNLTVVLTLLLLAVMGGAGFASATWGFRVGDQALKGISTPDSRPTKKPVTGGRTPAGGEGLIFLREEDILPKSKQMWKLRGEPRKTSPLQKQSQ